MVIFAAKCYQLEYRSPEGEDVVGRVERRVKGVKLSSGALASSGYDAFEKLIADPESRLVVPDQFQIGKDLAAQARLESKTLAKTLRFFSRKRFIPFPDRNPDKATLPIGFKRDCFTFDYLES
jgi:hypothetical protein